MRLVARRMKVALGQESVTAKVGTGPDGSGGYALTVELHIRLPELDTDVAQQLADAAHRVCPFSNAVRGNIDVTIVVDPAPEVI